MLLQEYLSDTHEFASPEQWGVVQSNIPQQWIEQALQMTGVATLRKRRLPMEQALWLVLGVALLRDRSIVNVAEVLELALPGQGNEGISSSALSQARQRLGSEPLQWLFRHTAAHWAHREAGRHRWQGLSLYALDGVVWRTPDTQENRQHFGCQRNHAKHQSPFPLVRMACLLDARARLLVDASVDAYDTSEYTLAERLWPQLPPDSLVIVDKGFYSAGLLWPLQHRQGASVADPRARRTQRRSGANARPRRREPAHEGLAPGAQERPRPAAHVGSASHHTRTRWQA